MNHRLLTAAVILSVCYYGALGFTPQSGNGVPPNCKTRSSSKRWLTDKRSMTIYSPQFLPSSSNSQNPPPVSFKEARRRTPNNRNKQRPHTTAPLSNSILASCDTLPRFSTARGLLSPETVVRLEELNRGGSCNEAVTQFLNTYKKQGPMSCLCMLADPDVLPLLTEAMRDIA